MNIRAKIFGGKVEPSPVVEAKKSKGSKADTLHSIPVTREEHRRGNTRGEDRHRLPQERVRATHDGRDYDLQLINLSGGGAMVTGAFEPMLWDRVELHLGENGMIECAVRWIKGDRIGLEFAHETRLDCSADAQAQVLREVITRSFPDLEFDRGSDTAEEHGGEEQRSDRRHPLIWSGMIQHDYQRSPVRLRNISETGAMVDCTASLRVGGDTMLDLGEAGEIFATVSWVVGDSAGLRFHEPFDLDRLARSRPDVAPGRGDRATYPGPGAAAGSPWDDRMSLTELKDELEGFLKR